MVKEGLTVVVTGGTRGIGFAIAEMLVSEGYNVHVVGRTCESVERAIERLTSGGRVSGSAFDLSEVCQVERFAARWQGRLYGLVNNAGVWFEERLDEPDGGTWEVMMRVNLSAVYYLTKGLCRWFSDGARIVNISSQLGTMGRAGFGGYCASKHGVIGLTRCWAIELGCRAITVNAVCPGWVRTESNLREIETKAVAAGVAFEERYREIAAPLTLKRFVEPREVAALVSFLMSAEGGGVTGQAYEIR